MAARSLILLLCGALCGAPAAVPAQAPALPAPVKRVIDGHRLPGSSYALLVQEIGAEAPLLGVNVDQAKNPASVIKLLTTLAGLETLGPAYTWQTEVHLDGSLREGTLVGNLVLKGGGDPYLVTEEFWRLLKTLRRRGLQRITGDLLLDASYFDLQAHDPSAFDGQGHRVYNVGPHALLLNFQAVNFYFYPGADGQSVRIETDPQLDNLVIDNKLRLGSGACGGYQNGIAFGAHDTQDGARVTFSGTYPARCGEFGLLRTVMTPEQYALGMFRTLWRETGGEFQGKLGSSVVAPGQRPFLRWSSRPLGDLIRSINKFSNNVMTRHLLLAIGAEHFGAPATVDKGVRAVREFLAERGIAHQGLAIVNGSGLSREERISARTLADLLLHAWQSPFMSEYISSLSISGLDGTMRRRFAGNETSGRMHLKTGTLDGVAAVAGYVHARSGRRFVVVAMINHDSANLGPGQELTNALLSWTFQQ